MLGLLTWSCTIGYYLYLWKTRKLYELDRVTLVIACSLLLIATIMSM